MTIKIHTPGPWIVDPNDEFAIKSKEYGGIGMVHNEPAEIESLMNMARANAQLIAAAPDLLEAAQATLRLWNKYGLGDEDKEREPVNYKLQKAIYYKLQKAIVKAIKEQFTAPLWKKVSLN